MNELASLRAVRAAQNQALCREVNERVDALAETYSLELGHRDFVCECADTSCADTIRMTVEEYEAVRSDPARFVVLPSEAHVLPDVEVVAARTDRYWTVRKIGSAAEVAQKLDPRSRRGLR